MGVGWPEEARRRGPRHGGGDVRQRRGSSGEEAGLSSWLASQGHYGTNWGLGLVGVSL